MADVTAIDLNVKRPLGGVPFGNLTTLRYEIALASGVFTASDKATAVAINDVILAGVIPEGFILVDAAITSDGVILGATNADIDVGFEYIDGADVTALPEGVDVIFNGLNADAAIYVTTKTASTPKQIAFTKDAYLSVKVLTAALSGTGTLKINLIGICDQ